MENNPVLPWLALTYTAARLGFEAQNAAAFRLLRLAGGITKPAADEIVPEAVVPTSVTPPASVAAAPKRRYALTNVHKKSASVRKPEKRVKRG
jgi:hypothetical protein